MGEAEPKLLRGPSYSWQHFYQGHRAVGYSLRVHVTHTMPKPLHAWSHPGHVAQTRLGLPLLCATHTDGLCTPRQGPSLSPGDASPVSLGLIRALLLPFVPGWPPRGSPEPQYWEVLTRFGGLSCQPPSHSHYTRSPPDPATALSYRIPALLLGLAQRAVPRRPNRVCSCPILGPFRVWLIPDEPPT